MAESRARSRKGDQCEETAHVNMNMEIQNVSECAFETSPSRAHAFQYVRVVPVHTQTFWIHTRAVIVSSAYQNLPTYGHHVLQRFKETFGSCPISV